MPPQWKVRRGRGPRAERRQRHVSGGFPVQQRNVFTFEGQMEQMGHLARGLRRARGPKRTGFRIFFLAPFAITFVICVVAVVVQAVT